MSSLDEDEATAPNIVTINAGGKLFQTYQETLTRGSAYFQAYFHGGFSKPDPRKPIFLDMDDECFRHLLIRMRMPGYEPPENITEIRSAAAFLGMELPPTPTPEDLAVRLQKGDCVKVLCNGNWRMDTFCGYFANQTYRWDFQQTRKDYLVFAGNPHIRVTDPVERAKILAREPDLTRVVFSP